MFFGRQIDLRKATPFERVEIPLGNQNSVRVQPKPLQKTTKPVGSSAGLGGEVVAVEAEYSQEWEIRNDRKNPITIILTDDLPINADPRIKVMALKIYSHNPQNSLKSVTVILVFCDAKYFLFGIDFVYLKVYSIMFSYRSA